MTRMISSEVAMPTYEFVTVDVFTDRRFGGNPFAVSPMRTD